MSVKGFHMLIKYIQIVVALIVFSEGLGAAISSTQTKIIPSSTAGDQAGYSVSISGDTALVGVIGADGFKGAAYIYTRSETTWTKAAKLTASDRVTADDFGWSVSIENDTVVVGAIGDQGQGSYTGSAYVFVKSGATWIDMNQTAKLTASNDAAYNQFGYSVSISGDTILIGADYAQQSGAAYIFVKPTGGWANMIQTAKLTASDAAAYDDYGCSVSLSGDTALIGADDTDNYNGSAYIFEKPSSGWANMTAQTAKLTASNNAENDEFGYSVSLSGDTALIGAVGDNSDRGSAYIFEKPSGGWADMTVQTAKLTASNGATDDSFGISVSISGDTALIGAVGIDTSNQESAYIFTRQGNEWKEQLELTAADPSNSDDFGISVSLNGDTAMIGADGNTSIAGAAYFDRFACGFTGAVIADQWSMIGIPCDLGVTSNTVEDVFGDNFTIGDYYSTWILYRWNRGSESYSYLDPDDTLSHDEGYWLLKTDSNALWDASGTLTPNSSMTGCISDKGCVSLPLTSSASSGQTRFNLVGHPQNITSKWADIRFVEGSNVYTPNAAQDANLVSATFWKYNGSSSEPYDESTPGMGGSLKSHEGFWVKMLGDSYDHTMKIIIPYGQ